MKRNLFQRMLSGILVLVLMLGYLPAAAQAQDASVRNDVTLSGSSSFGNLLTNTVNESQALEQDSGFPGRICDLVIEGNVATVEYSAPSDANLVVAVYDPDSGKMLGSGLAAVTAEETIARVTIEIATMPYYFKAGAYLLDAATNDPLSEEFKTDRYTKVMQDILAATVEDFNPALVLNLDGNPATNFAVFNENTLLASPGGETNRITDNGDGTYTIENADDRFLAMQPGDTFAYTYPDGTVLIVNAASVRVSGGTVTVKENPDAELSTVFDFVKIEEDSSGKDYTYDDSDLDERLTVISDEEFAGAMEEYADGAIDVSDTGSIERTYELAEKKWGNDTASATVKGAVKLGLSLSLKVYVSSSYQYVSFSCETSLSGSISLDGKLSASPSLGRFDIAICLGVYAHINPQFVFEASGKLSYKIEVKGTLAWAYDSDLGRWNNTSSPPSVKSKAEFDGKLFLGLKVKAGVAVITEKAVDLSFTGTIGFEVSAKEKIQALSSSSSSEIHTCSHCFEGEVFFKLSAEGELRILNRPIKDKLALPEFKLKLTDFYVSVSNKDADFTRCPHKAFMTAITVKTAAGVPVKGVPVRLFRDGTELTEVMLLDKDKKPYTDSIPATGEDGVATVYLPDGSYSYKLTYDGEDYEKSFTIKGTTKSLEVNVGKQTQPPTPGNVVASGSCGAQGDNVKYTLTDDGVLTISGNGAMKNYSWDSLAPWYGESSQIKSVVIMQGVSSIGDYAFTFCAGLTSVSISNSVTTIGEDAFSYCESLSSVTIPDSVTSIGMDAFSYCESLTSVTISGSVTSIDSNPFYGCWSLTDINIDPNHKTWCSVDGVWFSKDMKTLIMYPYAKRGAYECPDGVTTIDDRAFGGCYNLTSVTIPDSVTSIGEGAFIGCSSLTDINFDPNHKTWCSVDGVWFSKDMKTLIMCPCAKRGAYECPDGVTTIGDCAFSGCHNLTSVTIPDSVTSIGSSAFQYCSGLTSVTIPDSVASIRWGAFCGCYSLTSVTISHSVTSIDRNVFSNCKSLTTVTIPDSVTSIGEGAFLWCSKLTSVTIPDSVTSIGSGAFQYCSGLTSVTIPDSVASIGSGAFESCGSLTSVTIPDSVTSIGSYAFFDCYNLTSVTIAHSVTSIGRGAFQACAALRDVYYSGTAEQWSNISIESNNSCLTNASIHFTESREGEPESLTEPTEPETEPTEPVTKPTEPVTEPTEAEPTEPVTEPTEAVTEPVTEPTETETEPETEPVADEPLSAEGVSDVVWYVLPEGVRMETVSVPQRLSAFTGTQSVKNGVRSVKFSGLEPGEAYVLIVSLAPGSLVPEELQYIDQANAAPDGTLLLSYVPRQEVTAVVQLYGIPGNRRITLDRTYLTLEAGAAPQKLTAQVSPEEWGGDLVWSAENPEGTEVISVNAYGDVTARNPGTAYAVARVTHGKYAFTARCRVDVTAQRPALEVTGVQLGTQALTTELFRTDYAAFRLVLLLEQNLPDTLSREGGGAAIARARFTDEAAAAMFDLAVKDDRTLLVVPRQTAIDNPKAVAGRYSSRVTVTVDGRDFTTDAALTLTVKKSTPKLKASALTFNPFYTGQSQAVNITGATVTDIALTGGKTQPGWLTLEGGKLTLTSGAPAKASGKVYLTVRTAEWAIPADLTLSVKAAYTAPKLKLSDSTVTLAVYTRADDYGNLTSSQWLRLLCVNSKDTLEKLNVSWIETPAGWYPTEDTQDLIGSSGWFPLQPGMAVEPGKITLKVHFSDTENVVELPLTVKTQLTPLKVQTYSYPNLNLNTNLQDGFFVPWYVSPQRINKEDYTLTWEIRDSGQNVATGLFDTGFWPGDDRLAVMTRADTPAGKYKLYLDLRDETGRMVTEESRVIDITVLGKASKPSLSIKPTNVIDLAFPNPQTRIDHAWKNFYLNRYWDKRYQVLDARQQDVTSLFDFSDWNLSPREGAEVPTGTYTLRLTARCDGGTGEPYYVTASTKVTVKRTPIKLKLSKTSLSLNKAVNDAAVVDVTCLTKGYDFQRPLLTVPQGLTAVYENGRLLVSTNDDTRYGAAYKLLVQADKDAPAVTLTVKIPDFYRSTVTATLKAKGSIDVIRSATAITVTPAYKNYMGISEIHPCLTVESGTGGVYRTTEGLFDVTCDNGVYTITRRPGAVIDTALKYRAKLTFDGGEAYVNLSVKSGTAKFTVSGNPVLYKADRYSRGDFRLETKDLSLNPITQVVCQDARFTVYTYGNGDYALGFAGSTVPEGKLPTSVKLTVCCEGSPAPKATVTLKLKLQ